MKFCDYCNVEYTDDMFETIACICIDCMVVLGPETKRYYLKRSHSIFHSLPCRIVKSIEKDISDEVPYIEIGIMHGINPNTLRNWAYSGKLRIK